MLTIVELIKTCGLRKATLAKLSNCSRAALTRYEKGQREPELVIADRLASITKTEIRIVEGQIRFIAKRRRGAK